MLDPYRQFSLAADGDKLRLIPSKDLPDNARTYLVDYLKQTEKYRNISRTPGQIRFSLYQPVMNSPAGERSLYMRLRRRFCRDRVPQAATIGVTRACQCNCMHCSADYHMDSMEKQLGTGELVAAIQEAVDLGVTTVILLGGEPLLKKDLEAVVEAVDPKRAQTVMFTNGEYLFQERCASLYEAGLSGVFVSLDSTIASEHDDLRERPGLFSRIKEGVQNSINAGMDVALSSYLTSQRLESRVLQNTMELGKCWSVQEVTFFDAIPVGRLERESGIAEQISTSRGDDCSLLSVEDRRFIQELTTEFRRRPGYPAITPQSTLTSALGSSYCFAANTQFYLSSTGQMCPCDFTPLTIGHYPTLSIRQLWMAN